MSELKPCPFCGSAASLIEPIGKDPWYHVVCQKVGCNAKTGPRSDDWKAAKEWNTRASTAQFVTVDTPRGKMDVYQGFDNPANFTARVPPLVSQAIGILQKLRETDCGDENCMREAQVALAIALLNKGGA